MHFLLVNFELLVLNNRWELSELLGGGSRSNMGFSRAILSVLCIGRYHGLFLDHRTNFFGRFLISYEQKVMFFRFNSQPTVKMR